ncbi:MAG: response regulator transcription factor [Anaerolineales bacterium]|nr:response regulator transcription factor [Anaerolineales bacterium]
MRRLFLCFFFGTLLIHQLNCSGAKHEEVTPETLTERERDVLNLLAQGKTNKEIAGQLFITERTVKFHVSSILGKLGAGNRTEAVTMAAHLGLVNL